MREKLRASYSETGRPSIDPEALLRILLLGISTASPVSGSCWKNCVCPIGKCSARSGSMVADLAEKDIPTQGFQG